MITFIFIYAWISFYKETFQMFSSFFYQVTSLFFLRTFPVVIFFCNSLLSLIFALYFIVVLLLHFFLSFIYPHRESPSPFRPNFAILFIIKGCWKLSNLFSTSIKILIYLYSLWSVNLLTDVDQFPILNKSSIPGINIL